MLLKCSVPVSLPARKNDLTTCVIWSAFSGVGQGKLQAKLTDRGRRQVTGNQVTH